MAAYHETALLYNLNDTDIGRQLKLILIKMKVRIRMVEASQYLQPIGFLAGIKDMEGSESVFQETGFSEPMLLLHGFGDSRLDLLLQCMRRKKIRIPLKAVITPENKSWNSLQLYKELCREHEAMKSL